MKSKTKILLLGAGLLFSLLVTVQPGWAALGQPADSIASDRRAFAGRLGSEQVHKNYTVQVIDTDSVTIREYVSESNVVFGIAWNGLTQPDLKQLLGSYSGEYEQAVRRTPRKPGRRSMRIKTSDIVVEKWGHMRNLQGRAYVPALVPEGVSIDEIK